MDKANGATRHFLAVDPEQSIEVVRGLASPIRLRVLKLLNIQGPMNVNAISEALGLPQSTIATNIQVLELGPDPHADRQGHEGPSEDLLRGLRGDRHQLRPHAEGDDRQSDHRGGDAARPLHELQRQRALRPVLDRGDHRPPRRAGPLPRSRADEGGADLVRARLCRVQVPQQRQDPAIPRSSVSRSPSSCSSEVPGTASDWPSDITVWVNDVRIGTWTSPGDFGDKRGALTPALVEARGLAVRQAQDLVRVSSAAPTSTAPGCRGSRSPISTWPSTTRSASGSACEENTRHPGGINIFGRGFGNHDQDIVLRLHLRKDVSAAIQDAGPPAARKAVVP